MCYQRTEVLFFPVSTLSAKLIETAAGGSLRNTRVLIFSSKEVIYFQKMHSFSCSM